MSIHQRLFECLEKKETTLRYRCISESGVESRWSRLISQRVTEIEIEQMCPRGIHQ